MKDLSEGTSTRWVLDLAGKLKMPDDTGVTRLKKLAKDEGLDTLDAMRRAAETAALDQLSSPSLKDWLQRARRDVETHREA